MPARTLNDFFAGFFYRHTKECLKVDMRMTFQKAGGRNGGEEDGGQEIKVHCGIVPQRKE